MTKKAIEKKMKKLKGKLMRKRLDKERYLIRKAGRDEKTYEEDKSDEETMFSKGIKYGIF
jgi:hypothetical protein